MEWRRNGSEDDSTQNVYQQKSSRILLAPKCKNNKDVDHMVPVKFT
jgi:hypothetical protein